MNELILNAAFLSDGYKTGHHSMEPDGLNLLISNWTPRTAKRAPKGVTKVVSFGQQMVIKYIVNIWNKNFFLLNEDEACSQIEMEMSMYLGKHYDVSHFRSLHKLGFLPIEIRSIKEGSEVPFGVPMLTINNTHGFGWVTNYLETIISNMLWQPMTSATIAKLYRRILDKWAYKTDPEGQGGVDFQAHDFSMRGMGGIDSAIGSGLGHATSFLGSDSLPVIWGARNYYNETGFVIGSVNATEHAVMCAGTSFYIYDKYQQDWSRIGDAEFDVFKKLITESCPSGIVSIVSDTFNLWTVLTDFLPRLKNEIMARDGKVVIRPDSSRISPIEVISGFANYPDIVYDDKCPYIRRENGDVESLYGMVEYKGVIEALWDVFGGVITSSGYKKLDPHIGMLYGDAINPVRMEATCENLMKKGFASTNVVFGCGSMTYQLQTRDSLGFAMKATYAEVKGIAMELFKDPITDKGFKKSARGLVSVFKDENGEYKLKDQCTIEEFQNSELELIFKDGKFLKETTLSEIRQRLNI